MLGSDQAGLRAGRHALAWILGQANVWYVLYRCAHYVSKGHGPSQSSNVSVLEDIFSLDGDLQELSETDDYNEETFLGEYFQNEKFNSTLDVFTIISNYLH